MDGQPQLNGVLLPMTDEEAACILVQISCEAWAGIYAHYNTSQLTTSTPFPSLDPQAADPDETESESSTHITSISINTPATNEHGGDKRPHREDEGAKEQRSKQKEQYYRFTEGVPTEWTSSEAISTKERKQGYVSTSGEPHSPRGSPSRLDASKDVLTAPVSANTAGARGKIPDTLLDRSGWDTGMKNLDRETDEIAGIKDGWPDQPGQTTEEATAKWLNKKIPALAAHRIERNSHWPQLEAGEAFIEQMSRDVMPGSGERPLPKELPHSTTATKGKRQRLPTGARAAPSRKRPNISNDAEDGDTATIMKQSRKNMKPSNDGTHSATAGDEEGHAQSKSLINKNVRPSKLSRELQNIESALGRDWEPSYNESGHRVTRSSSRL